MSLETEEKGFQNENVDVDPKSMENCNKTKVFNGDDEKTVIISPAYIILSNKSSDFIEEDNKHNIEQKNSTETNIDRYSNMFPTLPSLNGEIEAPLLLIETKENIVPNIINIKTNHNEMDEENSNPSEQSISIIDKKDLVENPQLRCEKVQDNDKVISNLIFPLNKQYSTSSTSLNGMKNIDKKQNAAICKSPLSRSVENIHTYKPNEKLDISNNLNADTILATFTNQKSKISINQKLPLENHQVKLDAKPSRLNKELITQDIGSIMKNVHGIFSSVSKTAYSISQKATTQFKYPAVKLNTSPKGMPVGQSMNDIFEEENTTIELSNEEHNPHDPQDNNQCKELDVQSIISSPGKVKCIKIAFNLFFLLAC